MLRLQLRGRLTWFVFGPFILATVLLAWSEAMVMGRYVMHLGHPVHLGPMQPDWVEQLMRSVTISAAALPWFASAVALDRALRRLPTWRLAPWPLVGRFPVSALLAVGVGAAGLPTSWDSLNLTRWMALALVAPCLLGTVRLALVTRQMDRWIAADRRLRAGEPSGVPVVLPLRRRIRGAIVVGIAVVAAAAGFGTPAAVMLGTWMAWCFACISAVRGLRRWGDA